MTEIFEELFGLIFLGSLIGLLIKFFI
jgi:hypothetical protein